MSSSRLGATRLVTATEAHFDWVMAGTGTFDGLHLSNEELEPPDVLWWLKRTAIAVEEATGHPGAWLIVAGDEVVGFISFKGPPENGPSGEAVEIGYGVTPSRRREGHATRAIGATVKHAEALGLQLVAEVRSENRASQGALLRNGFRPTGERADAEAGLLVIWRRP